MAAPGLLRAAREAKVPQNATGQGFMWLGFLVWLVLFPPPASNGIFKT